MMASHCSGCQRHQYDEHNPTSDCPGVTCPECADAAEWHRAIMEEACDAETIDDHCTCVPVLRKEIARLQVATRKVVGALLAWRRWHGKGSVVGGCDHTETLKCSLCTASDVALADPVIVSLGRG
jgi:hypothetical protein